MGTKEKNNTQQNTEKPESKLKSRIVGFLFYATLIGILVALYLNNSATQSGTGAPKSIGGFTPQIVLTKSMQDTIPQDSIIISRQTDPNKLKVGDDITYMRNEKATVTHRIVQIYENYWEGQRGFMTQGTMNSAPDQDVVPAPNVVGKVIFHSLFLGKVFLFVKENVLIVGGMLVLLIFFFVAMKQFFRKGKEEEEDTSEEDTPKEITMNNSDPEHGNLSALERINQQFKDNNLSN